MTSNPYSAVREQIERVLEKGNKQEPEILKRPSLIRQIQRLEETSEVLIGLESEQKIESAKKESAVSISEYFFSSRALWYWLTILLAGAAAMAIFVIPENAFPLVYLRSGLGIVFVLFLPGFVLIKMLFPAKVPLKISQSADVLELSALSLGVSLALTPMVVLILNYTPWGVRIVPITLSLLALTVVLATTAVFRELKHEKLKLNGEVVVKQPVL